MIAEPRWETVKVRADEVRVGDRVHGPIGTTDPVESIRRFVHVVRITPESFWPITLELDAPITIQRLRAE